LNSFPCHGYGSLLPTEHFSHFRTFVTGPSE
jgi:hypothetical protein